MESALRAALEACQEGTSSAHEAAREELSTSGADGLARAALLLPAGALAGCAAYLVPALQSSCAGAPFGSHEQAVSLLALHRVLVTATLTPATSDLTPPLRLAGFDGFVLRLLLQHRPLTDDGPTLDELYSALVLLALDLPPGRDAAGACGTLRVETFGRHLMRPAVLSLAMRLLPLARRELRLRAVKDLTALVARREANCGWLLAECDDVLAWLAPALADVPADAQLRSPVDVELHNYAVAFYATLLFWAMASAALTTAASAGGGVDALLTRLSAQLVLQTGWHAGSAALVSTLVTALLSKAGALMASAAAASDVRVPAVLTSVERRLMGALETLVVLSPPCAAAEQPTLTPLIPGHNSTAVYAIAAPTGAQKQSQQHQLQPCVRFDADGRCADVPLVQRACDLLAQLAQTAATSTRGVGAGGTSPSAAAEAALARCRRLLKLLQAVDRGEPPAAVEAATAAFLAGRRGRPQARSLLSRMGAARVAPGGGASASAAAARQLVTGLATARVQAVHPHLRSSTSGGSASPVDRFCTACSLPIDAGEACVSATTAASDSVHFHAEHSRCRSCHQLTADPRLLPPHSQPLCPPCHAIALRQCGACGGRVDAGNGVDADAEAALGRPYHRACLQCTHCGAALSSGASFVLHADAAGWQRPYCAGDAEALFARRCDGCHRPLDVDGGSWTAVETGAGSGVFHAACYTCSAPGCGVRLSADAYFYTAVGSGGRAPLCDAHFDEQYSVACVGGCGKPVAPTDGSAIEALDGTWHTGCYVCAGCGGTLLLDSPVLELGGRPYHDEPACYAGACPPCHACGKPVVRGGVTVGSATYHHSPGCLRCSVCGVPLTAAAGGGAYREPGEGGALLCGRHYLRLHGPTCTRCGLAVAAGEGGGGGADVAYAEVGGRPYHVECAAAEVEGDSDAEGGSGGGARAC